MKDCPCPPPFSLYNKQVHLYYANCKLYSFEDEICKLYALILILTKNQDECAAKTVMDKAHKLDNEVKYGLDSGHK